jgi:hypothetical protein
MRREFDQGRGPLPKANGDHESFGHVAQEGVRESGRDRDESVELDGKPRGDALGEIAQDGIIQHPVLRL